LDAAVRNASGKVVMARRHQLTDARIGVVRRINRAFCPVGRSIRVSLPGDTSHRVCYIPNVRRVVLDSSVVISAFRSRQGASHRLLGLVSERRLVPLATPALFLEYEEVLKRPEQRRISGLTLGQVDAVLSALAAAIEPVDVHFAWRPQLTDSDDEMVFDTAINGQADALVTHNISDFVQPARRFGLTVLPPGELLKRMRQ
jgi:putative PIN family toxin of toxin-antitoxin system